MVIGALGTSEKKTSYEPARHEHAQSKKRGLSIMEKFRLQVVRKREDTVAAQLGPQTFDLEKNVRARCRSS
ncbi:hypothetical protein D6855_03995 [Butyrivibrio sp. CB08]|nr:hypothetical protein D6855_03995 [Butyrivibrio sp. CB08]